MTPTCPDRRPRIIPSPLILASLWMVAAGPGEGDRFVVGLPPDGRGGVPTKPVLSPAGAPGAFPGRPVGPARVAGGRRGPVADRDRATGRRRLVGRIVAWQQRATDRPDDGTGGPGRAGRHRSLHGPRRGAGAALCQQLGGRPAGSGRGAGRLVG